MGLGLDSAWQDRAACAGVPVDVFFHSCAEAQANVVSTFCNRCPVQAHCLDEHLHEEFGVFGGLRDRERGDYRVSLGFERRPKSQVV